MRRLGEIAVFRAGERALAGEALLRIPALGRNRIVVDGLLRRGGARREERAQQQDVTTHECPVALDRELYPIGESGRYCAGLVLGDAPRPTSPRARVVAATVGSAPRSMSARTLRWKSARSGSFTPERASWTTSDVA